MLLFLKRQITLATISGIPVRVDHRWVLVLVLMTAITAASIQPLMQSVLGSVILGIAATGLFFVSIFLHEFSHAVIARMEGLRVIEIVLHPHKEFWGLGGPPNDEKVFAFEGCTLHAVQ